MDDEALPAELDERQRVQPRERVLRALFWKQRAEQRERHAAKDRGGVEHLARLRVEPVEVQRREFLHHGRQDRVLGRVGALAHGGGGELERERVAAHEAVDPFDLVGVEPGRAKHLGRIGRRQRPQRDREQELPERGPPDRAGRVAGGDHDPNVLGQRGQELQPQPAVEQPQPLGGVDHKHVERIEVADRGEEALRGRLDPAAVDRHDPLGQLGPEGAQQRRLAGAGHAVDHGHVRPVAQRGKLVLAADERAAALGQQRPERPHAGSGAATMVLATCLIASVGSRSDSACSISTSGPDAS